MLAHRGKNTSTIRRSLATITHSHRLSGHEPSQEEAVRSVTAGIHRKLGVKPERQDPITSDVVRKILKLIPVTVQGARDWALLLTGFAGAFRRSDLVVVQVKDLELQPYGLLLDISRPRRTRTAPAAWSPSHAPANFKPSRPCSIGWPWRRSPPPRRRRSFEPSAG